MGRISSASIVRCLPRNPAVAFTRLKVLKSPLCLRVSVDEWIILIKV